ncbi:MAG: SpoIIE family protein phosphatase [Actinomycetota bacterium]
MIKERKEIRRGSWRWTLRIAELITLVTAGLVLVVLHATDLPARTYIRGLILVATLSILMLALFRILSISTRWRRWAGVTGVIVGLAYATWTFALLRGRVPEAHLIFIPVIVVSGILSGPLQAFVTALLAVGAYWAAADILGEPLDSIAGTLDSAVFLLTGLVGGLLASELRSHYRAEQESGRLATAVRHRLLAVLDAVDEAIVFRDRLGVVRIVNQRAGALFEIDPSEHLGDPAVELLRTIARKTEDPEGFMETFQDLRDDPDLELRVWIEQILPERRKLRLFSAPAFDETGVSIGRIDVFTDITESVRRADEIERLYESARKTAESYQRSLLPDTVPSLPRVNMVAHYIPAAGRRAVCGDFYDFITLPHGRIGIVIGDVVGAGPAALSEAALARYTLRSFATEMPNPGRLLEWMNGYLGSQLSPDRFVRLVFGLLDPERAVLEYANAGHVAPVLYRAKTQSVERLSDGDLPLGVIKNVGYELNKVELEPGDMLILYTDGVTEAPRHGRPFGQGKFSDIVKEYGVGTPGELVQATRRAVDAWVSGELRDDLALLVFQVVPDRTLEEPTRELVLPNEPARMGEVRMFVASFLADVRVPVEVSQEVLLAVGEAAANACRHGRPPDEVRSEVRIQCALEGEEVTVVVADDGRGFAPEAIVPNGLPDRFAAGGRGLFLIHQLMDDVDIDSSAEGTTVRMTRRIAEE